jgi:hypothetical protein
MGDSSYANLLAVLRRVELDATAALAERTAQVWAARTGATIGEARALVVEHVERYLGQPLQPEDVLTAPESALCWAIAHSYLRKITHDYRSPGRTTRYFHVIRGGKD